VAERRTDHLERGRPFGLCLPSFLPEPLNRREDLSPRVNAEIVPRHVVIVALGRSPEALDDVVKDAAAAAEGLVLDRTAV